MAPRSRWAWVCAMVVGCGSSSSSAPADAGELDDAGNRPADAGSDDADAAPPRCAGKPERGRDSIISFTFEGESRSARVHLPTAYDGSVGAPVVLDFHGSTSSAVAQELFTNLDTKADAAGFVAVHPEGIGGSWNAGSCCDPAAAQNVDDTGFVRALLDELDAALCVDPRRIFATGMSNGGEMAHRLACELADRIAAVAPVAGGNLTSVCEPARPISVLHMHGTKDPEVPFEGDDTHPPIPQTIAEWVERDQCSSQPVESFAQGDARCETYPGCAQGVEVTLCTVEEGGHTWPGGIDIPGLGKTSKDLVANDAMWSFFERHPLR